MKLRLRLLLTTDLSSQKHKHNFMTLWVLKFFYVSWSSREFFFVTFVTCCWWHPHRPLPKPQNTCHVGWVLPLSVCSTVSLHHLYLLAPSKTTGVFFSVISWGVVVILRLCVKSVYQTVFPPAQINSYHKAEIAPLFTLTAECTHTDFSKIAAHTFLLYVNPGLFIIVRTCFSQYTFNENDVVLNAITAE